MMHSAEEIARSLGRARRVAGGWSCKCPVPGHGKGRGDKNPSLSIRDEGDTVLTHCHGGCSQEAVIDVLKSHGLWKTRDADDRFAKIAIAKALKPHPRALALWREAVPATGTFVERYLRARGIICPIPPTIRFLRDAKHPEGRFPAMLAAVARVPSQKIVAVHRTFLAHDGSGKAPVEPEKMSLGSVSGGAVRLTQAGEHLAVAEGIETALSVFLATGIPMWSALSADGIAALALPPLPLARTVTICADADDNGTGIKKAYKAAERWFVEGRIVRITCPPTGTDFNDILLRKTKAA